MSKLTVTGQKLARTRVGLEVYLKIYEDHLPVSQQCAYALLCEKLRDMFPDALQFSEGKFFTHGIRMRISMNVSARMRTAFDLKNPNCPAHDVVMQAGLMSISDYIDLIKYAMDIPKALCNDVTITENYY